jgi:hypothetical protein
MTSEFQTIATALAIHVFHVDPRGRHEAILDALQEKFGEVVVASDYVNNLPVRPTLLMLFATDDVDAFRKALKRRASVLSETRLERDDKFHLTYAPPKGRARTLAIVQYDEAARVFQVYAP